MTMPVSPARDCAHPIQFLVAVVVAIVTASGCTLERVITEGLLIRNVTLIDGTDRGAQPGMSVAVASGRIVAVGPAAGLAAGPGVTVMDGSGKFLIPGLWDMHVHLAVYAERSFPLFLANGVTTVREVGGELQQSLQLRRESGDGARLGPSVLIAGPMLESEVVVRAARGTPAEGGQVAVPDSATAAAVVDSLARAGVDLIKVHAATPRVAYFAAMRAARRHGLSVAGHVPDSVMPREAIAAGQRSIEHGSRQPFANSARGAELTQVMLGRMQRYLDSASTGARPLGLGLIRWGVDDSAQRAFDLTTARTFAVHAAGRPVWFDPTLVVYRLVLRGHEPEIINPPEIKFAPPAARGFEELPPPRSNPTEAEIEEGQRQWAAALQSFAELVHAGAKFVAGTDVPVFPLVPGFSLQTELQLLGDMGLSPHQVLQAATRNAAEAAGRLAEVGTVEPGKVADLVLLEADPMATISNTARIDAVITRGRVLDRTTLDRLLADAEAYAREP